MIAPAHCLPGTAPAGECESVMAGPGTGIIPSERAERLIDIVPEVGEVLDPH